MEILIRWLLVAFSFLAHRAIAAEIEGPVVAIADGETLTILDGAKRQHKIRLDGIDAPERRQAFGARSRQSLAELCTGKAAMVHWQEKDRYGRTIGRVICAGIDANAEPVRRGMAWVYKRYVPVGSYLHELEAYARLRQIGLWADSRPMAPWDWRKSKRR